MEKVHSFEDLEIWKEGMRVALSVYELMNKCKDLGLKDQMQRAAVSIPSNIAEGFERKTQKEFVQYLYIAKGSCGELRTQTYLAYKLKYIKKDDYAVLIDTLKFLSVKINKFITFRKTLI